MTNKSKFVAEESEIKVNSAQKYTSIQFIGLCMSTTPSSLESIEDMSDRGYYAGLTDMEQDINARINFLRRQIIKSTESGKIVTDRNCLKIFVVPEFFFRGNKGAYLIKEKNAAEFFQKYFRSFFEYLNRAYLFDWIFVLGSVLTSKAEIDKDVEPTKELYPIGDYLLAIYDKLKSSKDCNIELPPLHEFLKSLDLYQKGDTAAQDSILKKFPEFAQVLRCTLEYCDSKANIVVDNSCFIVTGNNSSRRIIRCQKKYKSKEDFVLNSTFGKEGRDTGYLQSITKYENIAEKGNEEKGNDSDEYAVFDYGGIRFGIDICLDHSRKRLLKHLSSTENYVDVQIIPSCGMEIKDDAVIARTEGYVFNCDGEYVLDGEGLANNGEYSHTSLRQVKQCIPTNGGKALLNACMTAASHPIELNDTDRKLFPRENNHLHFYLPVKIDPH